MKKSGYRAIFHIYFIFFLFLIGIMLVSVGIFFSLITIGRADGSVSRSDWPKEFTDYFSEEIIFADGKPGVTQAGLNKLMDYGCWVQILDDNNQEVFSFDKPGEMASEYSGADLIRLSQAPYIGEEGQTAFIGTVSFQPDGDIPSAHAFNVSSEEYTYIIGFPMKISKVTMYLNGTRFTSGKTVFMMLAAVMFLTVGGAGIAYGYWMMRAMNRISVSIHEIAERGYLSYNPKNAFSDVYLSLNALDAELKESDRIREQTEHMREEWIANITHDLKTPLSPVRGYAELLCDHADTVTGMEIASYAGIMKKNLSYADTLIDDLKLTYQLQNDMFPMNRQEGNLVRFLKELVIDLLNHPEYESRVIHFESNRDTINLSYDGTLLARAFNNLLINAFVHGEESTEITLRIAGDSEQTHIVLSDNGKGMTAEETGKLFSRYYRGTNTDHRPEGTGLGLAIAKQIIEIHEGTISVSSFPGSGTEFYIDFKN